MWEKSLFSIKVKYNKTCSYYSVVLEIMFRTLHVPHKYSVTVQYCQPSPIEVLNTVWVDIFASCSNEIHTLVKLFFSLTYSFLPSVVDWRWDWWQFGPQLVPLGGDWITRGLASSTVHTRIKWAIRRVSWLEKRVHCIVYWGHLDGQWEPNSAASMEVPWGAFIYFCLFVFVISIFEYYLSFHFCFYCFSFLFTLQILCIHITASGLVFTELCKQVGLCIYNCFVCFSLHSFPSVHLFVLCYFDI